MQAEVDIAVWALHNPIGAASLVYISDIAMIMHLYLRIFSVAFTVMMAWCIPVDLRRERERQ